MSWSRLFLIPRHQTVLVCDLLMADDVGGHAGKMESLRREKQVQQEQGFSHPMELPVRIYCFPIQIPLLPWTWC